MYKKIYNYHNLIGDKMRKVCFVCLAIIMIIFLSNTNTTEEIIIPNESIRIRVIANSNSKEDQELKQKVRKSIQIQLAEMLKEADNIDEVRAVLNEKLPEVEYTVERELQNAKKNSDFDINYGYNFFPQKIYKGITYEEGIYESVVIKLGESNGDNWWCVLFPPLCLMESDEENMEEVEYKSFIKEIINKYF